MQRTGRRSDVRDYFSPVHERFKVAKIIHYSFASLIGVVAVYVILKVKI